MPVIPESKTTVSFFAKDLKPKISNFEICIVYYPGGHPKDLPPIK
jgi:hypothetical protein